MVLPVVLFPSAFISSFSGLLVPEVAESNARGDEARIARLAEKIITPALVFSFGTVSEAKELIGSGYIGGGMLPKLGNCIDAVENGVARVHILDGRIPHFLLLEIFTNKGIGTAILKDDGSRFYHGE